MLHLIPAPLHRLGYRIAYALRRRWWRLRKPHLAACRVLARDAQGRILLIRHTYGSPLWMLPGGGIARGETPLQAAVRELREETGCVLLEPSVVAETEETVQGAQIKVYLATGTTISTPRADTREIAAARFFAPDALPGDMPAWLHELLLGWAEPKN